MLLDLMKDTIETLITSLIDMNEKLLQVGNRLADQLERLNDNLER